MPPGVLLLCPCALYCVSRVHDPCATMCPVIHNPLSLVSHDTCRATHAPDDVAQVRHVVDVRQGAGDEDVAPPGQRHLLGHRSTAVRQYGNVEGSGSLAAVGIQPHVHVVCTTCSFKKQPRTWLLLHLAKQGESTLGRDAQYAAASASYAACTASAASAPQAAAAAATAGAASTAATKASRGAGSWPRRRRGSSVQATEIWWERVKRVETTQLQA